MADELTGPTCNCGKPFRRRRKWFLYDGGQCTNCGAVMECIRAHGEPWFVISQPTKERWEPWTK
jgi:hypothetical protein